MANINPFKGYRPKKEVAAQMASPPYDVLSSEEACDMAKGNPLSYLHVSKAEIDLAKGIDVHTEPVYQKAKDNLMNFINDGNLFQDREPCYYIYKQIMGEHHQVGLVAGASVDEYQNNLIKKHELTRIDKEMDRAHHIEFLGSNSEPVFLTYKANTKINTIVDKIMKDKPIYDFKADDGISHIFWVVSDKKLIEELTKAFVAIPYLYVADGHHRSAAAARVRDSFRAKNAKHSGKEQYNFFLAVIFPHDQMKIMDYNRVVKDLAGLSSKEFLAKVSERFDVSETKTPMPETRRQWGMYLDGKWYRLKAKAGTYPKDDPLESLDVAILQNNLLAPILNIKDPRTEKRIDFVGGIRGHKELERRCQLDCKVAFQCVPTGIDELMAIADAGKIMPPKSTWFEPKLRSGLIIKMLND